MKTEELLVFAQNWSSSSTELARYLSLASRISPALVRRFRLHFMPRSIPGIEAELWFSPLVEIRSKEGILFQPEAAAALRWELSLTPKDLFGARGLLSSTERTRPFLVRLEEELIWLGLKYKQTMDPEEVVIKLRQIAKSIVAEKRDGLGRWALAALSRIPEIRDLSLLRTLLAVAESQLFDGRITLDAEEGFPLQEDERALILGKVGRTQIGVRLAGGQLGVREPPQGDDEIIEVPATRPRYLVAKWSGEGSASFRWEPDRLAFDRVPVNSPVTLLSLAGDRYEVLESPDTIASLPSKVQDFLVSIHDSFGIARGPGWLIAGGLILTSSQSLPELRKDGKLGAVKEVRVGFPFLGIKAAARIIDRKPWPSYIRSASEDAMVLLRLMEKTPGEGRVQSAVNTSPTPVGTFLATGFRRDLEPIWRRFHFFGDRVSGTRLTTTNYASHEDLPAYCGSPLVHLGSGRVLGMVFSNSSVADFVPWQTLREVFPQISGRKTVFISYSHQDQEWKDRVVKYLKPLDSQVEIEVWDDRASSSGAEWRLSLEEAVNRAAVAILIISTEFLTSRFIQEVEVPYLIQRRQSGELTIVPVIARPCNWMSVRWLTHIQTRPKDGRPLSAGGKTTIDKELASLALEIQSLLDTDLKPSRFSPAPRLDLGRLPTIGPEFVGREAEMDRLDKAWEDPKTHVVTLVAFGGVGKSALVSRWLDHRAATGWLGVRRAFDWSFYSQGTEERVSTADRFLDHALRFFGDPDPTAGSPRDRGLRLAELVRREKTLLVLDGVEPLQHPPGPLAGRLKDPGLSALLKGLAAENPGLCLVTTREHIADLNNFTQTAPQWNLENLTPESGTELLRKLGVEGRDSELKAASEEMNGHALALTLLGNYLRRVCGGDVRRRKEVDLGQADERLGGYAFQVIRASALWLGDGPERAILRVLGLFNGPAELTTFAVLRRKPAIPGLTERLVDISEEEWNWAISSLREQGILLPADPHQAGTLDVHPLVRAFFQEELEKEHPEAWREGNLRLYEYLKESAPDYPESLEAMEPLYSAVVYGCRAGRQNEALHQVLLPRIHRRQEAFSLNKLGAFGSELTALSGFFDHPWDRPSTHLTPADQALVLNEAGFDLRALGRLMEAAQPMQASLERFIVEERWKNSSVAANNLSELTLILGEVLRAVAFGEQSVELADRSGDAFQRMSNRTTLADALHQAGRGKESGEAFRQAEAIQIEWQPEYPRLYSLQGYRYCDLLLSQSELEGGSGLDGFAANPERARRFREACQEVRERARQALEGAEKSRLSLLAIALDHLCLGRTHLGLALTTPDPATPDEEGEAAFSRSGEHLDRAVDGLRQSGREDYLPRGLLARAAFWRLRGNLTAAKADLDEALEIAERGSMRLFVCDAHLEWARLCLQQGDTEAARRHVALARKLVDETGYGRREREVRWLESKCG